MEGILNWGQKQQVADEGTAVSLRHGREPARAHAQAHNGPGTQRTRHTTDPAHNGHRHMRVIWQDHTNPA